MKSLFVGLALVTASAFAQSNPNDCFKVKNNLDRRYCMDKYLETVKDKNAAEKKVWDAGVTPSDKASKSAAIEEAIQNKKDQIGLLQSEITIWEKHLADLRAAKETAAAAPAPEKKKKKKGFRIKL